MEMPKCCWKFTADWSDHLLNQHIASCHGVLPSQHHSTATALNHPLVPKTRHAAKSTRLTLDSRVRSPPRRSSRARALLSASRAFSSAETYRNKDDISQLVQTDIVRHSPKDSNSREPLLNLCIQGYKENTKMYNNQTLCERVPLTWHLNMLRDHSQHWHNSRDKLCKSTFEGRICEEVNKELESIRMAVSLPALPGNVTQRNVLRKPGLSSNLKRSFKEVIFLQILRERTTLRNTFISDNC